MKDFVRVMRLVFRRRLALVGCLLSSLLVAGLWGANISAVYPMADVVFMERSGARQYVDAKLQEVTELARQSNEKAASLQQQVTRMEEEAGEGSLEDLQSDALYSDTSWQLKNERSRVIAYERQVATLSWLKPYSDAYFPDTPFDTLLAVVIFLIAATMLKLVALMTNMLLVQDLSQRVAMQVREKFFRHALKQDLEHYGEVGSSALTSRLTGDANDLAGGVSVILGKLIREPLKMIVCLVSAGIVCWRLLLLTFIVAPVIAVVIQTLSRAIRRSSRRVMEEMTQLYGMLSEAFAGIRIVRAYNTESYERARFRQGAAQYYRKSMKFSFYNSASRFASEALGTTVICTGLLAGGYLVLNQKTELFGFTMRATPMGPGEMMLFFGFLIGAADPARKLSDVWSNLQRGIAAAERLMEFIDAPVRVKEPQRSVDVARPHQKLVFEEVRYRYPTGPEVLKGLNLEVPHGQSLAIVGPNGSGKSTLISLLCRFDDPSSGAVKLNDTPLTELRGRDLRKRIGLVTQRTVIFDDTILNNIRYGSPNADREMVIEAAKRAHADEFIREKTPHGYDSMLGTKGTRLSGGQMQRIALARAFLRNPDILVLDEATSQIDLESEQLIHEALADFLEGRTGIMITHRPTTLELADQIAVIENGCLSDHGDHSSLLLRNSFYQSLCGAGDRRAA